MQEYVCDDCGNVWGSVLKPLFCPNCFQTAVKLTPKSNFFYNLEVLFESCKTENWGGYGELPASKKSYRKAVLFAEKLNGLPYPEIAVNSEGDIVFYWYWIKDRKIFSITFSEKIIYAGIVDGENTLYCTFKYVTMIHPKVKKLIKETFSIDF